jgi:adenylosuccinate synthase
MKTSRLELLTFFIAGDALSYQCQNLTAKGMDLEKLKNKIDEIREILKPMMLSLDELFNANPEHTQELLDEYDEYLENVKHFLLHDMAILNRIVQAYKLDAQSLSIIVEKILEKNDKL